MTLYIMSKCPYGNKVLRNVTPLAQRLGDRFELRVDYIGSERGGALTSMHGESEVVGDMLGLCVARSAPYQAWLGFLECQTQRWREIPDGWESCAVAEQIDVEQVRRCVEGAEGASLLRASFQRSTEAEARGSPTIYLNGERYSGGRSEQAFGRAICASFADPQPQACADLPPPPEVPVTALVDARCLRPECDIEPELVKLRATFPGAVVTSLDYSSPRGRALFEEAGIKMLPALLFNAEVALDTDARSYFRGFKRRGGTLVKQIGRFDPALGAWQERPEVPVQILADSRCKTRECQGLGRFTEFLQREIPGAQITTVDYGSPGGKALWGQVQGAGPAVGGGSEQPVALPLALFGKSIELEEEAYERLQRRFRPVGQDYLFVLGRWDPTAEICDNGSDDDGDGRADCSDTECQGTKVCRTENARELRLFMMGQCPYGNRVLEAMSAVLDHFGRERGNIDFRVDYVGRVESTGRLVSMHGQAEVEENLRRICVQQHYGAGYAFMDFLSCRAENYRAPDWESCANGPIDPNVIRRCAQGEEGMRLLTESFRLAEQLGVTASPTWLLNNRYDMSGREPQEIVEAFCQRNPMPECRISLSAP